MTREILEDAYSKGVALLQKRIDEQKEMPGILIVELKSHPPLMTMFKPTDQKLEATKKRTAIMFIMLARALGEFRSASIVSEAWVSNDMQFSKDGKRPFDDPNKIDSGLVGVYTETHRKVGSIPIKQMGGRRWLDYAQSKIVRSPEAKITGWLDQAFNDPPVVLAPETHDAAKAGLELIMSTFGGEIL